MVRGAEGASNTRLVTRNAVSLVFPLPINYRDKIRRVPGVTGISMANWFAGIYITEKNFFPQFAVDAKTLLRPVSGVHHCARADEGVHPGPEGRGRRTQARAGLRVQGGRRGAAAGHDLSGHVELRRARDLRWRGEEHRHEPVLFPLGLPQRDGEADDAQTGRQHGRVRGRVASPELAADVARDASTTSSGTVSPKR